MTGLQRRLGPLALLVAVGVVVASCGAGKASPANGAGDGGGSPDATGNGDGGTGGTGDAGGMTDAAGDVASADGTSGGDGAGPPPPTCTPPIQAADTSTPTTVVGSGTAASCTEAALAAAVAKAGVITFACGGPATITVASQLELSLTTDTVIDGGGMVTLDGGGKTRILDFNSPNYRATKTTVTLQHLTLAHGRSTGTPIAPASPPCSQGYNLDGGGAGIFVRDGVLHVIDVTFDSNVGATPGPDVAGGGIYANGSLGVVVVGSRFVDGSGSNGGGLGSLNSDLTLVNDTFSGNEATGSGANSVDTATCDAGGGEVGNGGNGGAVSIDGGSDGTVTICGSLFANNSGGALGGALFRTPDGAAQDMNIDRTTFDGNTAVQGGGAMYIHNSNLNITASTLSNNSAPGAGAIQSDGTTVSFINDTFAGNSATKGLGGGMSLFGNGGTIQSCTFANNTANGGSGLFGGAIAGGTTLTINDTLFDQDTSMDCGAPMACQDGSSTGQADLQWPQQHVVCATADTPCAAGGTTFADAKLGALGANGGPTQTMVPAAGSPAIGAGKTCPTNDQRGDPRKPDGCTIGAVETQ